MRNIGLVIALCGAFGGAPALAWEHQGHELVGAIAQEMLDGTKAGAQVKQILGHVTLAQAAKWPDCVRSVAPDFVYHSKGTECTAFETSGEQSRMEDYARRNWKVCEHIK